jgi:hypothetical protein
MKELKYLLVLMKCRSGYFTQPRSTADKASVRDDGKYFFVGGQWVGNETERGRQESNLEALWPDE